ncbi:hypothetical protein C8J55DRAFT_251322 [Lentinula edodes]|uniref:Uncharacterized protein n=1 Tax=Lentinula lateritia TaxID=40482 RepID=A0A9W9AW67_9AGAR|nr:hypothetical protein C8J55DRAFT_251322 [Lentinula edodes]
MLLNALCTPSMSLELERSSAKYLLYATPSKSGLSLSQYATMKVDLKQPKIIFKYLLYAIVLANLRGAPIVWHWRVFWPIIKYNIQFLAFRVPNACATLLNRGERARRIARYIDKTSPVGVHPFDFEVIYRSRVSVDESDFNMHMSNSSYPKILDFTRTKMATHLFPHFLRAGGVVPIASTHFHFVREIPMLAKYEVRAGIGAWDEKWFYVSSSQVPPLTKSESDLVAKLFDSSSEDEEDIILHTIAVARCCYKLGRITVPPSVLMATNGVCVYPHEVTMTELDPTFSGSLDKHSGFSVESPPHTWTHHARNLALNPRKLRELYKGAWRQDPTRWWDSAMGVGGPVEEKLKERLGICKQLFEGMDGVRQFGEPVTV